MKAEGLNEVFFATILFGLNGYFIANVYGNEGMLCSFTYSYRTHINLPPPLLPLPRVNSPIVVPNPQSPSIPFSFISLITGVCACTMH